VADRWPGKHGRPATYSYGCRCADCRTAWRDYSRERSAIRRLRKRTERREACTFGDGRQGTETVAVVLVDGRRFTYRYCVDHAMQVVTTQHRLPVAFVESIGGSNGTS
jgi:hypothetical protein